MTTEILSTVLAQYPPNKKEHLLPILQDLQHQLGHLDDDILAEVGKYLNLPVNNIYGVAAFYDCFHFHPKGKCHIRICNGTGCHLAGSSDLIPELEKHLKVKPGGTSRDRKFSLEITTCMGACDSSPVMEVNGAVHLKVTAEDLNTIIRHLKEKTE